MKQSLLTLSAAFALAGVSQAIFVIDNFDGYTDGDNMNGLISSGSINTWAVTNGIATPGGEPIAIATSYTFDVSAGAALIGGFEPTSAGITALSSSASVPMFGGNYGLSTFTIDFGFLDSLNSNRDDYKISLTSTGGANLLTINLTPSGNVNQFDIGFNSVFFTGVSTYGVLDSLDSAGNPYFSIEFKTFTDGNSNMYYSLKDTNGNNVMSSGVLTGTNLTDNITAVTISVDTDGAAGDGFLVIDNVVLVPEPSSALLGLLGAAFAFTRRRR